MTSNMSSEDQQKLSELVDMDKSQMDPAELTSRVHLALDRKYQMGEWALFHEVTGKHNRRADAIAYNMYPSRNFKTIGFEIKVTRGDWKKELQDVSKADWFVGQVDEWYVVQGRKGVVRERELPEGWGLLTMKAGGKLYTTIESNLTEHQDRPLDPEFYIRPLKKALYSKQDAEWAKKRARQEGYKEGKQDGIQQGGELDRELEQKIKKGEKFEQLQDAGLPVSIWLDEMEQVERISRAVELLKRMEGGGFRSIGGNIDHLERQAETVQKSINSLQDELAELQEEVQDARND